MNFIFVELFFEEMLFRGRIVRERLLTEIKRSGCEPDFGTNAV